MEESKRHIPRSKRVLIAIFDFFFFCPRPRRRSLVPRVSVEIRPTHRQNPDRDLSTYAKKVTVSVLYWYEKLSGNIVSTIFETRKGLKRRSEAMETTQEDAHVPRVPVPMRGGRSPAVTKPIPKERPNGQQRHLSKQRSARSDAPLGAACGAQEGERTSRAPGVVVVVRVCGGGPPCCVGGCVCGAASGAKVRRGEGRQQHGRATHLSTNAKKVTVSVLYWYE